MRFRSFYLYAMPVLLYTAAIFYFSSMPNPPSAGMAFLLLDKLEHAFEYFILAMLLLRALKHYIVKHPYVLSVAITALYGVSDEIHQLFVPGRVFSVYDIIADAVGASVILVFYVLEKKMNKKRE
ncbi:MAG TPA: VanZ family protein [Nanoarchaeota archaeon]|nr:VanZ family protein [Nanoarchaeota archaeon]